MRVKTKSLSEKGYFYLMKTKYYTKMLFPLSLFGFIFRVLEIVFAVEPSSGFYYYESVIPLFFNIYLFLVIMFFLSEIFLVKSETKTLRKRLGGISVFDKVLFISASVFVLASALKDFLFELNINYSYASVSDVFSAAEVYVLILAALSVLFTVLFVADPQRYSSNAAMSILSLSFAIYYLVRMFMQFMDMSEILSKAYGAQLILLLGFMVLAFTNMSKILAGILAKRYFVAFGLCSVFLAAVHLPEFIMYFLPENPYNISVDIFSYIADFLCAAVILRMLLIVSQKQDKPDKNSDQSPEIGADPSAPQADTVL